MIDFQLIDESLGFPVYLQKLPVQSVSIYWLVFVGSADDELVGEHGIYHWFEHVPSRGTAKFPGGYLDTEARLVRHGGDSGAETDYTHTAYYATMPRRVWAEALDILTDMLAQPLFRDADVEAEREIIQQEYDEWHSSPYGESMCELPALLWPGHPLGHDQLGSPATLNSMDAKSLRRAHAEGYVRNRCTLFVSGDLEENEVRDVVAEASQNLAHGAGNPRRSAASYGTLPKWKHGQTSDRKTRHEDSVAFLLFPVPPRSATCDAHMRWTIAEYMITAGDLGSPLNRMVRETSQLAYSPSATESISIDGGYWGLEAQTSIPDPQKVIDCFWEVLRSEELRSAEWFEFVQDTIRGEFDMFVPDPSDATSRAAECLTGYGELWSDHQLKQRMLSVTRDEMVAFFESLSEDDAHSILFRGSGTN